MAPLPLDPKELSKRVCQMHNTAGFSLHMLEDRPLDLSTGVLVNICREPFTKRGQKLTEKNHVRTFLYGAQRNGSRRIFNRGRGFIWTAYAPDEKRTYMGLGTVVSGVVAGRLVKRNPRRFQIVAGEEVACGH